MIALQWCISFCFITKWISYKHTYIPISLPSCISLPDDGHSDRCEVIPHCDFFFINLFIYLFIYLFLAVLGLRFCARAFSSCGEWGPLFIAMRGPLTVAASPVAEHRLQTRRLSSCGSRAQLLRGMWDLPRPGYEPVSPCIGRQNPNHCATREAPSLWFWLAFL